MGTVVRLVDGLLLGLAVACLVGGATLRLLPLTGHELVAIAGRSMEPAIPVGSLVVVRPTPPDRLTPGDVVTVGLGAGRAVVTHRVVRVVPRDGGTWLELRGDANPAPDPVLVPGTAVVGRAVLVTPGLGRVITVAATPAGFMIAVGLGGLLAALSMAVRSGARGRRPEPLGAAA